jgi:dGTPase
VEENFIKFKDALKHKAFLTSRSLGRKFPDDKDSILAGIFDPYEIDAHKIRTSESLRRLSSKTQVWPIPQNPLVHSRLTHTLEVLSVAVIMARVLGLNVNLVIALAWSHDVGHAPFGHLGEKAISDLTGVKFSHEIFGPILLQEIECLNLSFEVLEGVPYHDSGGKPLVADSNLPLEYAVVMIADKIAFLFSDPGGCLRQGYLKESDFSDNLNFFGRNWNERINYCLASLFAESQFANNLSFVNSKAAIHFEELRKWMYANVYNKLDEEAERIYYRKALEKAFYFLHDHLCRDRIWAGIALALMSEREVIKLAEFNFGSVKDALAELKNMSFMESFNLCKGVGFRKEDMDLSWAKKL